MMTPEDEAARIVNAYRDLATLTGWHCNRLEQSIAQAIREATYRLLPEALAGERESCARLAEDATTSGKELAAAIRARGGPRS